MSFSARTKSELARKMPEKACCQLAEFLAFKETNGIVSIKYNGENVLEFGTENASVARKVFKLGKNLLDKSPKIFVAKKNSFKKNNVYTVSIPIKNNSSRPEAGIEELLAKARDLKPCCKKAYLRGALLAGGSIIDPKRTYHLEITSNNEVHAKKIAEYMKQLGLKPGISRRKQLYVVYLKEAEQIIDFLNIVGAHAALLTMENIRIYKSMRNRVNRLVNCETANMNKSINAALKQIEDIQIIQESIGLAKLPVNLYEVAKLRLKNPDASLKELGEMLTPPVGKSGVNHRMRRIGYIAEKIRNNDFSGECW